MTYQLHFTTYTSFMIWSIFSKIPFVDTTKTPGGETWCVHCEFSICRIVYVLTLWVYTIMCHIGLWYYITIRPIFISYRGVNSFQFASHNTKTFHLFYQALLQINYFPLGIIAINFLIWWGHECVHKSCTRIILSWAFLDPWILWYFMVIAHT